MALNIRSGLEGVPKAASVSSSELPSFSSSISSVSCGFCVRIMSAKKRTLKRALQASPEKFLRSIYAEAGESPISNAFNRKNCSIFTYSMKSY